MDDKNNKSFTLIELLVVIAIIGVISSIVLISMGGSRKKARITAGLQFSQTINHTMGAYAVGIWDFNEGSGVTAQDRSGYANHGAITGATYVGGPSGAEDDTPYHILGQGDGKWALQFDGSSNHHVITSAKLDIPQEYTLAIWIKGNLGDQVGENIYPFGWNGKVELTASSGSTSARGGILIRNQADTAYHAIWDGTNVLDGRWHFWVATVNSGTGDVYIYLDGEEIHYGTIPDHYSSPTKICIGAWTTTYGNFTGKLDEVRIYERALTALQIQQRYVAGAPSHGIVLK